MSRVLLAHGSGGAATLDLLYRILLSKLPQNLRSTPGGAGVDILDDGAVIKVQDNLYIVVSVDSYTVSPLFFPGGDIGKLAASGTINDIVAMGAKPVAMLDSIVVEEGFPLDKLDKITSSLVSVVEKCGVSLIGGDLKVMPRGQIDGIVITTVGIGLTSKPILDIGIKPGDKIVITGPIAEHGATIMALQHGLDPDKLNLESDCRPLIELIQVIEKYREHIHAARDPTRGGVATVLNEWARQTRTLIIIDEDSIPVRDNVRRFCEMMGVDPLYLACEGVMMLSVDSTVVDEIVHELRELGFEYATVIGEVKYSEKYPGIVVCKTRAGGLRIVEPLRGELVPRIC